MSCLALHALSHCHTIAIPCVKQQSSQPTQVTWNGGSTVGTLSALLVPIIIGAHITDWCQQYLLAHKVLYYLISKGPVAPVDQQWYYCSLSCSSLL